MTLYRWGNDGPMTSILRLIRNEARQADCPRLQVGAALYTPYGELVGSGYNQAIAGRLHTADSPCRADVHAEAVTIGHAAWLGRRTAGLRLAVTHSPCVACAQLAVVSGIRHVSYIEEYRDPAGLELLVDAGVYVTQVEEHIDA